jgi:hypothetical protein
MKKRIPGASGMSLNIVLCLVSVMMVIASAMAGVSLMNLNITQSFYNGNIALNEAEAGVSKLLYNLSESKDYGLNNEEIVGTMTDGMGVDRCYHRITFNRTAGAPWSTNAKNAAATGYRGRTVPKEMIHAISTGYCQGQYRSIEVLIHRPPFPYALASSGRIYSEKPMFVEGVLTGKDANDAKYTRPGHICSNFQKAGAQAGNPEDCGIFIGTAAEQSTYISGFAKSAGLINVKMPAIVRGGIRPTGDSVDIPFIDSSRYQNKGEKGVIQLMSQEYGSQKMDAMYYCCHDVTYAGTVEMNNSFLFVENGTLTISGSLKGVGAIVVRNGKVVINGDTTFGEGNKIALISDGDVELNGNGNYFQGIVYSHGNVKAKQLTVLGNLICEGRDSSGNPDSSKMVTLDACKLIQNAETGTIGFTAHSSSDATSSYNVGYHGMPCIGGGNGCIGIKPGTPPEEYGGQPGWYTPGQADQVTGAFFTGSASNPVNGVALDGMQAHMRDLKIGDYRSGVAPDAGYLCAEIDGVVQSVQAWQASELLVEKKQVEINDLERQMASTDKTIPHHFTDPPPLGHDGEIANPAYTALVAKRDAAVVARDEQLALRSQMEAQYKAQVEQLQKDMDDYYRRHADKDGSYNGGGKTLDITKNYSIDLNEFLPAGCDIKIMFWHSYNSLM